MITDSIEDRIIERDRQGRVYAFSVVNKNNIKDLILQFIIIPLASQLKKNKEKENDIKQ